MPGPVQAAFPPIPGEDLGPPQGLLQGPASFLGGLRPVPEGQLFCGTAVCFSAWQPRGLERLEHSKPFRESAPACLQMVLGAGVGRPVAQA